VRLYVLVLSCGGGDGDDHGPKLCEIVKGAAILALCGMLLWCWFGKGGGSKGGSCGGGASRPCGGGCSNYKICYNKS